MRSPENSYFDEEAKGLIRPRQKQRSRRWILVVIAFISTWAIASVLFARIHSTDSISLPSDDHEPSHPDKNVPTQDHTPSTETEPEKDDPFRLHPQDHRARSPMTQRHYWKITKGPWRADGVLKELYLVNGTFPGPTIEARSGDRLIIHIENALPDNEGVAFHWHGLTMRGANDMDGAVGVTQDPIPAGSEFTYEVPVGDDEWGTYWWHAHEGLQRSEGLFGGLIVHQPAEESEHHERHDEATEQEEHLLLVSDWYHRSAIDALHYYSSPGSFGNEAVPDSILVNGAGIYDCSKAVPARPVDCEDRTFADRNSLRLDASKSNILRVVNVGSYGGFNLTLDEHSQMIPLRVDGGSSVKGSSAKEIGVLYPGQRVDVLVERTSSSSSDKDLTMALMLHTDAFRYENLALTPTHNFPMHWSHSSDHKMAAKSETEAKGLLDLSLLKAAEDQSNILPEKADMTIVLYAMTQKLAHLENKPLGFMNRTTWEPQSPPLLSNPKDKWDKNQLVTDFPYNENSPKWVDIVLNNRDEDAHPFHIHGHGVWVLSTYSSTFNWGSWNPFDDKKPMPGGKWDIAGAVKRDTILIPRRGYAILRMKLDNPGLWMMHCHVLWHQATGMSMIFDVE